jgi:hypothetical protein
MARAFERCRPGPAIPGRAFGRARAGGAQALALTLRHNGLDIGKKDFLGAA